MLIKSYGLSDIGKLRDENQDAYYINDEKGLYIVADGMGGMFKGREAAEYVVNTYRDTFFSLISQENTSISQIETNLTQSLIIVNEGVRQNISTSSGSTIVVLYRVMDTLYSVNLGDSLGYLIRNSNIIQLTKEHNLAGRLKELGLLTNENARSHRGRNLLTQYVGMQGNINPYVTDLNLNDGDKILICTDGLTEMLSEKEILKIINDHPELNVASKKLIQQANDHGGHDNITVVLLEVCF